MITVENVEFGRKTFRINGISFKIYDGKINGIGGLNGSGKTTILNIMYGFLKANDGAVYIDGKNLQAMKVKDVAKYISVVHQETPNPMNFTVYDVISLSGYSREKNGLTVDQSLELCKISELKTRQYSELSGGEKRMVLFAAALFQDSKYVMLDEPFTFLDVDKMMRVSEIIKRMRDMGKTIVIVLHDVNQLYNLCDNVILLKAGKKIAEGEPDKVMNSKILYEVYGVNFSDYDSVEGKRFYPV
ncbi:MAG: ABC transporter ATP-binding protein [Thermoplasmata archaeon]